MFRGTPQSFQADDWVVSYNRRHYILRSTNLLILFGKRNNCHSSGKNLLGPVAGSCDQGDELASFIKGGEVLD
jgi:hypothetical protein